MGIKYDKSLLSGSFLDNMYRGGVPVLKIQLMAPVEWTFVLVRLSQAQNIIL